MFETRLQTASLNDCWICWNLIKVLIPLRKRYDVLSIKYVNTAVKISEFM